MTRMSWCIYRLYINLLYFFDFIVIDRSATYIETPELKIYWSEKRPDGMKGAKGEGGGGVGVN